MPTFSNKLLYTKGYLDYHCLTLSGNSTEEKFIFKEPIFNIVACEAVQGEIKTNNPLDWISVICREIDKKNETGLTGYDTKVILVKSEVPFVKTHATRYFSKPKDKLESITLKLQKVLPNTTTPITLNGPWIIQLELTTVRVATHTDWRNISPIDIKSDGDISSDLNSDKTRDDLEKPDIKVLPEKKEKKKKSSRKAAKKDIKIPEPAHKENMSSLRSYLVNGGVGALGVGTAMALGGVTFK
tara:strand:+ start:4162 stop:4887 length:726 start_codon:yes stop_codon:yes gene_type:complete